MDASNTVRRIVGCMTGTSLDGLDAALVEVTGHGLAISVKFVRGVTHPLGETGVVLKQFALGEPHSAEAITTVTREFALLHATAVKELLEGGFADLIAVHGQTVFHKPPLSWQLFNPAILAAETGFPVVSDFRSLDLARGGEGAPITPLTDFIFFRSVDRERVIVNFGGFINITRIPRPPEGSLGGEESLQNWLDLVTGRDVCVCNQLLDRAAIIALGRPCDSDGVCGLNGRSDLIAQGALMKVLHSQATAGKSLGAAKEAFVLLEQIAPTLSPADLLRTVSASIASVLAEAIGFGDYDLLVAGGGVFNQALMDEVNKSCGKRVILTDIFDIPVGFRESTAMAVLGALAMDGYPITLPAVTGAPVGSGPGAWTYP